MLILRIQNRLKVNTRNAVLFGKFLFRKSGSRIVGKKTVFFDIDEPRLERYLYCLLKMFDLAEWNVTLKARPNVLLNLRNFADYIYDIESLEISIGRPTCDLAISNRERPDSLLLDTNFFASNRTARGFDLPFSMHPEIYHSGLIHEVVQYRERKRRIRVLYGGNLDAGYNNREINDLFGKLNRAEITDLIDNGFANRITNIYTVADAEAVLSSNQSEIVVLRQPVLPFRMWLELLASSEFIVAPAGYVMPFSNNIIEAMSVGTIPITQYPEYFSPPLEDGSTCIRFDDRRELISRVAESLSACKSETALMSRKVWQYYDDYLDAASTVRRVFERRRQIDRLYIVAGHMSVEDLRRG